MEIKKINLDRKPLTVDQIKAKENFSEILANANLHKPGIWKSPWFYGAIGLSSLASFMLLSTDFETKKEFNVKTSTLNNNLLQANNNPHIEKVKPFIGTEKQVPSKKNSSNNSLKDEIPVYTTQAATSEYKELEQLVPQVKKVNGLPSIAGIANGAIKSSILKDAEIIESGFDFKINGYKVNYFNGYKEVEERLEGNALPTDLREKLINYNLGDMVFFTELRGVDNLGINRDLPSMNLRIVKN
jgi:hypothetical protein